MIVCELCNIEQKSLKNLSKHLSNNHHFSPKTYYDLYLKKDNEDMCTICGKETKYYMFTVGYRNTCSRKCAAILSRQNLKADEERFESFREKVSANQERIWEERAEDGTDRIIRRQISKSITANNASLTVEERQDKFGWLNKLSDKERETWKEEVMFKTGSHRYWANATEDQRKDQQIKRCTTMIHNGNMIAPEHKTEKQRYYERVRRLSYCNYNKYRSIINPNNYTIARGNIGYHLDHIFSIQQGFLKGVPEDILASASNLQVLPGIENNKKSSKCWQTLDELMEKYNNGE